MDEIARYDNNFIVLSASKEEEGKDEFTGAWAFFIEQVREERRVPDLICVKDITFFHDGAFSGKNLNYVLCHDVKDKSEYYVCVYSQDGGDQLIPYTEAVWRECLVADGAQHPGRMLESLNELMTFFDDESFEFEHFTIKKDEEYLFKYSSFEGGRELDEVVPVEELDEIGFHEGNTYSETYYQRHSEINDEDSLFYKKLVSRYQGSADYEFSEVSQEQAFQIIQPCKGG